MANPIPLGNGRYRLVTDAPRDPVTGRRNQRTTTFTGTLTEAKLAQAQWEVTHKGVDHSGTSATFNVLADRYLEQLQPHVSRSTYENRERALRLHIRPTLGDVELRTLTTSHVDELIHRLTISGLNPSYVRQVIITLSATLNQACRWEWITRNPCQYARRPATYRSKPSTPDTVAVERFLDYVKTVDRYPWAYLFVHTVAVLGCRPAELCAVRWGDVDLVNARIEINGSMPRGKHPQRKTTKTNEERVVAVDSGTVKMLEKHRAATGILDPAAYVFSEEPTHQTPVLPGNMSTRMAVWQNATGVKVTLRSLRHYVATQLIGAGVDVRTVAGRLGHKNPAITLQVYSDWLPEKDREAAELLASMRRVD